MQDVVGQALRGHPDGVFVHPVRPHAHQPPEPSGAELEVLVECILQARRVLVAELDDLGLGRRVEVPRQPFLYVVEIVSQIIVLIVSSNPYKFS